ncbi:hypothetical protein [Arenimonas aestuarii]
MSGSFSLSWWRFAGTALLIVAMAAVSVLLSAWDGKLNAMAASVPLMCASLLIFFTYRWSRMRSDFAAGRFTENDFRRNPVGIVVGRRRVAVLWLFFTMVLVFLPVMWWLYHNWPTA